MPPSPRAAIVTLVAIAGLVAPAAADDRAGVRDGQRVGNPPLASGEGWIALVYELSLSTRVEGEPWALAADAAIALTPRLTLGLAQSAAALATIDRSGGACLDSAAHRCPRRYRGGAIDLRWRVLSGAHARLSTIARLGLAGLRPVLPYARLGMRADGTRGRAWAVAQLELTMSLGGRELGNRDTVEAPVWLGLDAGPVTGWLRTGVRGELADLGEKLEIPIALGVALAGHHLRAGVEAGWPQLLGPQNSGKQRQAAIWLAFER